MPLPAVEDTQETLHSLLSRGAPPETAEYALKVAQGKGEMDTECSDPTYIIMSWDVTRLEQLNQQWQVEDPAALVRNALIAAGMTATADNRVLGVTDANMASTRFSPHGACMWRERGGFCSL
ncbi:hypothetical protein CVIRNUC_007638 [Coccomyxa viridis]|uniref:Uncharacterized protein n=1 Tax=Coccomyxa viridis TaxID=1274662 RepID=A0AAV1IBM3_9CHLO|nr:hypothetical protein CVIRNUC_007638 [Coccomyxa viridis]